MEHCENCNHALEKGGAKCPGCGDDTRPAPLPKPRLPHKFDDTCGSCGALLPAGSRACLICGTERGSVPFEGIFPVPTPITDGAAQPPPYGGKPAHKSPDIWRRWSGGLSILLLVMIVSLAGAGVYQQYFDTSAYRAGESVVYEAPGNRLMLSYPGLDQPVEIVGVNLRNTAYTEGALRASPNGRWLAYTTANGRLYLVDLAQQTTPGGNQLTALRLADNVAEAAEFSLNSEYLVYRTGNQDLYVSDLAENWRLDTKVDRIIAVDEYKVLYTSHGNEGDDKSRDLYVNYLARDSGEWLLIDRNVTQVLDWTKGFDKMLYTSIQQNERGRKTSCLVSFDMKQNTTLATGIGRVVDASAEKTAAVYLVPRAQDWDYEFFIDDDMAEEDTLITEPDLAEYPALSEAMELYGEGADLVDIEDNENLVEQNVQYTEALTIWEEKQQRDRLRMRLRSQFFAYNETVLLSDLYVYQNGALTLMDSGIWDEETISPENGQVDVALNYVLYEKLDTGSLDRMKISALWEEPDTATIDLRRYFLSGTRRELRFSFLDGQPSRLYISDNHRTPKQWCVTPKGDGIYFMVGASPDARNSDVVNELFYAQIKAGVVSDATKVSHDVRELLGGFWDGVLFATGYRSDRQLFLAQGGGVRQLGGTGAAVGSVENGGHTLLYFSQFEERADTGDLRMLDRSDVLLAQDASAYDYRSDELVYIQKLGSGATPDLYMWRGGKERLLQQGVQGVLSLGPEE